MSGIPSRIVTTKHGKRFIVRCAQPDDAAKLLAYIRSVAQETAFFVIQPDEFPSAEVQERQWIQDHLDCPGKLALVVEVGGEILGSLSFENGPFRRTSHTGTFGVSVHRDWRGKGIGMAMLKSLLEWAEVNPLIEKLSLAVFSTNTRAIELYRRLGFVEEGRKKKEIKIGLEDYVDEVLMGRFVKPRLAAEIP